MELKMAAKHKDGTVYCVRGRKREITVDGAVNLILEGESDKSDWLTLAEKQAIDEKQSADDGRIATPIA